MNCFAVLVLDNFPEIDFCDAAAPTSTAASTASPSDKAEEAVILDMHNIKTEAKGSEARKLLVQIAELSKTVSLLLERVAALEN